MNRPRMLANRFDFHLPAAGARYRQEELRSGDLMLLRMRPEGAIVDEALDRPRGARSAEWSRLRFVLGGPLHVRRGRGVLLERGDACGSSEFRSETGRTLTRSNDWLDLYWRNGSAIGERLREGVVLHLSASSFARIERLAAALVVGDVDATLQIARDVLGDLRAEGLPFATSALGAFEGTVDPSSPEVARVLWQLAGRLSRQPMAIDLSRALGVSERHALRCASRYFQQFHLSASSWREFINCLRLEMGAFFMGAPRARTEDVSRFLGFSSPTSFCHAFHDASLPSPQRLQGELSA
jgi:AraC-like DNA-binding protein